MGKKDVLELGVSDDYTYVEIGNKTFYYGYEYPSIIGVPEENEDGTENEDFYGDGFVVTENDTVLFHLKTEDCLKLSSDFKNCEIGEMLIGLIPYYYEIAKNA